ncbi:MAG: type II toxin-antitoxin system VapB family antitoxin [Solirubrobacteraceae bacterium]
MRRTSIFLDPDVVADAQRELGTATAADTVREALADVVNRARRRRLRDMPLDLTMDDLRRMRGDHPDNPS